MGDTRVPKGCVGHEGDDPASFVDLPQPAASATLDYLADQIDPARAIDVARPRY